MPATTEKKRSSTEKAAEAALTRAALTCELAHRWAVDAWKADNRIHTDVATDAIHSLDLLTDAARVRSLTRKYDDPVQDAEALKRPIGALMVVLERLATEDPDNASLTDMLGKLRDARRELYAVTAHDSGIPVPRDKGPASEEPSVPAPAGAPQVAVLVRDLRGFAAELSDLSGFSESGIRRGMAVLMELLAARLADADDFRKDDGWSVVHDVFAAVEMLAAALRWLAQQEPANAGGRAYLERIANRLGEVDATLAVMLD